MRRRSSVDGRGSAKCRQWQVVLYQWKINMLFSTEQNPTEAEEVRQ
jgi:hypothetical protein